VEPSGATACSRPADAGFERHCELELRSVIDEPQAREVAKGAFESDGVVLGGARELSQGWFFPCVTMGVQIFAGVIVNKATCRPLLVMTHSPMASDLTLYDRGYQFDQYDLVVLTAENLDETVRVLHALHVVTLDTYYKNDWVYRVGRGLAEAEVRERLSRLPCVFSGRFDFGIENLEQAREAGWFSFKVFEYRGKQ
jgi:hypothetical protein